MLAAQLAEALHVGGDLRVGEGRVELGQAQGEAFELLAEGRFHEGGDEEEKRRGRIGRRQRGPQQRALEIGHDFAERTTFVVKPDGTVAATIGGVKPDDNVAQALAAVQGLAQK